MSSCSKTGFTTYTFKQTNDRFGLKDAATAHFCYKDDVINNSLENFLKSEETKIMITGGLFSTEQKFQFAEQIWPRAMIILNSNDWNPNFSYDLDRGVTDRIKILSTLRSDELRSRSGFIECLGKKSPDLRPFSHLTWLAEQLGVDVDAVMLWAMRLATDRFYEIISANTPTENKLEMEVKYWTARQRIKFKDDTAASIFSSLIFSKLVRTKGLGFSPADSGGETVIPELNINVFYSCLEDFFFLISDPFSLKFLTLLKQDWEATGRLSTHPYQGFREVRPRSVYQAILKTEECLLQNNLSLSDAMRSIMNQLVLRDGFKLSGGLTYITEFWNSARFNLNNLLKVSKEILQQTEQCDILGYRRLTSKDPRDKKSLSDWMIQPNTRKDLAKEDHYSPDRAELDQIKELLTIAQGKDHHKIWERLGSDLDKQTYYR